MKTRKQKAKEYNENYNEIPRDFLERLNWLCDKLNITKDKQYEEIIKKRDLMISSLYYQSYKVILYEEPEGSPRPRARLVNRENLTNLAMSNSNFIHIYSMVGHADRIYMKRLIDQSELINLNQLIYTPCIVEYLAFLKTPNVYSKTDKILAEIGLLRPIVKPDWDNIGKKYSDMYNGNVWIDDANVIEGTVKKYYSCLPRVEITLHFLNALYNNVQARQMENKIDNITYFNSKGELIT